ncbi:MAG: DUF3160 domain-containing protein [Bacteroidaceae bacterium]|nr:DUF3160 domain-containing protein [Bacteroidaceae bacterium]
MKTKSYFILIAMSGMLLGSCGGQKSKSSTAESNVSQKVDECLSNKTFFMLTDDKLPKEVNLQQDISELSYQNLRLLKAYVYATHGHWFMEGDLNTFFYLKTDWYEEACWKAWYKDGMDNWDEAITELQKKYMAIYEKDYMATYKLIQLSKDEQAFVDAIDKRMKELREKGDAKSPDGVDILNSGLAINMYAINDPSKKMLEMLGSYNVAMEPSNYEQLFNVYENNDYLSIPNFVTTDVMMQLYHMYFSYVLKVLEGKTMNDCLAHAFKNLLIESADKTSAEDEQTKKNAAWNTTFFAVGLNLLGENPYEIAGRANIDLDKAMGDYKDDYVRESKMVMQAQDATSPFFELHDKVFMYSLFKPRGHYTRKESTMMYFRAMMWLQKGCLMRENKDQLRQAISMAQLLNTTPDARKNLDRINTALTFLMGEPDNVSIMELADHLASKHIVGAVTDAELKTVDSWLKDMFKLRNRIKPKVQIGDQDQLNLMPQRYMFDSEILGTMYDPKQNAERAYPTGLDVMDMLGVQRASELLKENYNKEHPWSEYDKERAELKKRLDGNIDWDKTMYNKWMKSLITLQKKDKNQPGFMKTKLWATKSLNSALASWALLKHDAILYGEQPLAAECGDGGDFPDPYFYGYVEPNIAFWKELNECISLLNSMLTNTGFQNEDLKEKGMSISEMVNLFLRVSKAEIDGNFKLSDFNDYYTILHIGSTLEYMTLSLVDPDFTFNNWNDLKGADRSVAQVADVFTRNIHGCDKDGILYEASGNANIIYVIVNIGGEYRLTRGATYSYYEFVRPAEGRLTDEEWQKMLIDGKAPAVPEWFAPWLLMDKKVDCDQRFVYGSGC